MEKNSLKGLMARYEQRNAGIKLTGVTLTKTGVDKLMYRLKDVIKLTTQRSISGAYIDFHMLNQNIVIDISEGYESKKKNIKTYGSISVQFIPDIVGYEQGQLPYEANPIFATQVVGEDVVPAELSEKVHDGSIEDIRALFFEDYPSVIDWILENGEEFARQLKEMVTLKTCRVYQKQDDGSLKEMIAFRTYQEYEKTCEKLGKEEKEEKPKK